MTPDLDALSRRAVACPRWRWLSGVLAWTDDLDYSPPLRVIEVDAAGLIVELLTDDFDVFTRARRCALPADLLADLRPVLDDELTVLSLLALVQDQPGWWWVAPTFYAAEMPWGVWRRDGTDEPRLHSAGQTPAEALVIALETAP